jgi:putative ATPase
MEDLFSRLESQNLERQQPLAARMRPRHLDEVLGQEHLLGRGRILRRLVDAGQLGSIILFGPPGCGKTTLARLLAQHTQASFLPLSAVTGGVKELRQALESARHEVAAGGRRPVLFIDEIHRFSSTQQEALLPDVEEGRVALVGATTSNPSFAVVSGLMSRSQVLELRPLSESDIVALLRRAIDDVERGLGQVAIQPAEDALRYLARMAEGDARRALSALELAALSTDRRPVLLDLKLARESLQQRALSMGDDGQTHYDVASALIKSIRGSDVDAGLYWLARALEGGEDIRFLCRRLVILASEDIGNADPAALPLAVAAMQACEMVGLPECQLTLSQTVIYLALAPKSNACTRAIQAARQHVRSGRYVNVPSHLREGHYAGAKRLGHGDGYQLPHDHSDGFIPQRYAELEATFYAPTSRGVEAGWHDRLADLRRQLHPDIAAGDASENRNLPTMPGDL